LGFDEVVFNRKVHKGFLMLGFDEVVFLTAKIATVSLLGLVF
jgi:hypothetical protein